MAPPEAGDTEGEQLFGTPLAASDAGAEPPKFDPTEEQNTQAGPITEGSERDRTALPGSSSPPWRRTTGLRRRRKTTKTTFVVDL